MNNPPKPIVAATLAALAAALFALPPAAADPVEACERDDGMPGYQFDLTEVQTNCVGPCGSSAPVTVGTTLIVNDMPVADECHTVEPCPIFVSTGVIVDGEEYCYLPTVRSCDEQFAPTPTNITGVPGYEDKDALCFNVTAGGCPDDQVGAVVTVRRSDQEEPIEACV